VLGRVIQNKPNVGLEILFSQGKFRI